MKVLFMIVFVLGVTGYLAHSLVGRLAVLPYLLGFIGGGMSTYAVLMTGISKMEKIRRQENKNV